VDHDIFKVNNFTLQSGIAAPKAHLVYKAYRHLNESRDNVVVFPNWFCGRHTGNKWLIGEGRALAPGRTGKLTMRISNILLRPHQLGLANPHVQDGSHAR